MTPKSSKRPRGSYQPTTKTPFQSHKRLLLPDTNTDDKDEDDYDSMDDSDIEVIHFDPDCILEDPDLDEEDSEFEKWESLLEHSMADDDEEEFLDATQAMDTDSFYDLSTSDLSLDPDCISTDDEEAMEEFLIYQHARRQQKRAMRRLSRMDEEDEYDMMDEINMRYFISGIPVKKPCTMTSSAGSAAHLNMRRIVMPAREMLRNYFRSTELNRRMQRVKENANSAGKIVAVRGKVKPFRNVLSEKN